MMTNAQAALIAAATWYSGDDAPLETVLGYADRMESHLDDRGRQEATSAPQADERTPEAALPEWWLPEGAVGRCRVCGHALWQVDQRLVDRDGTTTHMLASYRDGSRPHEL